MLVMASRIQEQDVGDALSGGDFRPEEERIAEVVAELNDRIGSGTGEVRTTVYRCGPGGERAYLASMPADDFSLDFLRDTYGGGDYKIRLAVRGIKGIPPKNWRVTIEAPAGWRAPEPQVDPDPVPVAEPRREDGVRLLLEQSQKDRERADRLVEGLIASLRPPDPAVQMQAMMAAFQAFQAMIPKAPPAPAAGAVDGLGQAARLLELIRENTPVKPGESTGSDVLLAAIQGLTPVLRDAIRVDAGRPVTVPEIPGSPEEKKEVEEDQAGMASMAESMFVAQLVASAKAGGDQRQWIPSILAVVSPETAKGFLASPEAIADLAELDDGVMENRAWFEELGRVLLAHIDGVPAGVASAA